MEPQTSLKEYNIIIESVSHIIFNLKDRPFYQKHGNNLIGALVYNIEGMEQDIEQGDTELSSLPMQDASLCFSDEEIKQLLQKYKIPIAHTADYVYLDSHKRQKLFDKFSGVKLHVEEVKVIDCRDDEPEEDYDTEEDFFNPYYYQEDDWEFVLKVKEVI
ncbi:MAG: hypothetical protein ACRC9X_05530 [Bacteroidales bacterium]